MSSHVYYCNHTPTEASPADERIDIAEEDQLIDPRTDLAYRVVFVSDEAGQDDHLKVYLNLLKPGGDA